jgi:carbamoyltransferase
MKHLILTLGHGSSAILVEDGKIVCGFENERLTKIKSDSSFPMESIDLIDSIYGLPKDVTVYISHWFTVPNLPDTNKWFNREYLERRFPEGQIHSLSYDFTHHDAHMESAKWFAQDTMPEDCHILVADGFGTNGEVLSLYEKSLDSGCWSLSTRMYGYASSIGLLYQYATSYLGLKMNQDEYKLLGYEGMTPSKQIDVAKMDIDIENYARTMLLASVDDANISKCDPIINVSALTNTQLMHAERLDKLVEDHGVTGEQDTRILVATFVQGVTERMVRRVINHKSNGRPISNLVVAGGIFMNVKLNNMIARIIDGKTCIMPLCGDSGAGIGVYQRVVGDLEWPGHLFWGTRDLDNIEQEPDLLAFEYSERHKAYDLIRTCLKSNMIVNVINGDMEYGPRALGNTTTMARPTINNVEYINSCNNRSTVMPMAGFCTEEYAREIHDDVDDVDKSLEYMVCTRDFKSSTLPVSIRGAAHLDRGRLRYTGRTQIARSELMLSVLTDDLPFIINTSFNPHGTPIVYSPDDIKHAHRYMKNNDVLDRVITIVIKKEKQ